MVFTYNVFIGKLVQTATKELTPLLHSYIVEGEGCQFYCRTLYGAHWFREIKANFSKKPTKKSLVYLARKLILCYKIQKFSRKAD